VGEPFESWYVRHHGAVLSSLTLIAGNLEVAREATDEAFARAFEGWARVGVMVSPSGWVYRTALNILRRRGRRAAVEQRLLGRTSTGGMEVPHAWSVEVVDAIRSLPMRERIAMTLRYVADLSTDQIAEVMGTAPGAVGSTLHSGRQHLATLLGEPSAGPVAIDLEVDRDASS
jgi:RNA polymerase sigma-70 factor (ECF subfamily)